MGSSMQNEPKRYFAAIRLGDDVPPDQLGRRVERLRQLVSNFAKGEVQLAFSSGDERFVGLFFQTARHSDYPGRARQGHHTWRSLPDL